MSLPLVNETIMVDFRKMQALFENEEKDNDLIHAENERLTDEYQDLLRKYNKDVRWLHQVGRPTGKSCRPNGQPTDTTAAEYLRHIFLLRIQPPTEPKTAPQNPNCRYRAFGCTASYRA